MMRHARARWKALALASVLLSSPSAWALEGNTEADASGKTALRGLVRDDTQVSGGPVLISRADIESPLTRVRRVDLVDLIEGEGRIADPAFKAILLTPLGSTGRPIQPSLSGIGIIEKPEEPAKPAVAPGIPEIKSNPQVIRPQSPLDSAVNEPPNRVQSKPPPSALEPKQPTKQAASGAPQLRTATPAVPATPPRTFGPTDIAATRAFQRF